MLQDRLKDLLAELDISQRQFAMKIGLDPGYFSRIIRGKQEPTERLFLLIEGVFHVNRKWLESGDGPIFRDSGLSKTRKDVLELIGDLDEEQLKAVLAFLQYLRQA